MWYKQKFDPSFISFKPFESNDWITLPVDAIQFIRHTDVDSKSKMSTVLYTKYEEPCLFNLDEEQYENVMGQLGFTLKRGDK